MNSLRSMLSVAVVFLIGVVAVPAAQADQPFGWSHTWTYLAGPAFDDFHATYTGTGGTVDRVAVVMDTHGGGIIWVTGGNTVNILWNPWVMAGDSFQYTFNTAFPEIAFAGGTITKGGQVIGNVLPSGVIVDGGGAPIGEFEHSFVPAPGAVALLVAAAGLSRRRRR